MRPPGPREPRLDLLLRLLVEVARHGGMNAPALAEEFCCSVATVKRLIRVAREELDVEIAWHRFDRGGGEYSIEDWGLLDGARVLGRFRV